MPLHWIFYRGKDNPDGVVIIDGADLVDARINAIGFERGAVFAEGHMLNPELAGVVEPQEIGRLLSLSEANAIINRFEGTTADATESDGAPVASPMDRQWTGTPDAGRPPRWFFERTPSGYVICDANKREALRVVVNIAAPKMLGRGRTQQFRR